MGLGTGIWDQTSSLFSEAFPPNGKIKSSPQWVLHLSLQGASSPPDKFFSAEASFVPSPVKGQSYHLFQTRSMMLDSWSLTARKRQTLFRIKNTCTWLTLPKHQNFALSFISSVLDQFSPLICQFTHSCTIKVPNTDCFGNLGVKRPQ